MRILHVTDAYLPKQGGIEVQVHDLATHQLDAGHEVEVMTCAPDTAQAGTLQPSPGRQPRVHRLASPWGRVRRTDAMIRRYFAESRPDVVHAHLSVLSPLSILAVRAAARSGVPVLATLHSLWWWATPLYRAADLFVRWSRWPVHWSAVSELAADPLRSAVSPCSDVTVLPNGVEPRNWIVDPAERDATEVVVVSVMRLAARKRPRALLGVVRRALPQLPPGVRLSVVIVGDGPQRARLERRIRRSGLQDVVHLAGRMQREEIRELYRRADVYIAPAILESFGIAALEARCAGVPVIARRQTGIADFVRHRTHGMLAASDVGLAGALVELASSPRLRERMAETNRACALDNGWSDVLHRCELAYSVAQTLAGPWTGDTPDAPERRTPAERRRAERR